MRFLCFEFHGIPTQKNRGKTSGSVFIILPPEFPGIILDDMTRVLF